MEFWQSLVLLTIVLLVPKLRKAYLFPDIPSPKSTATGRLPFFDFIKGIAIIAVILIHSIYLFVEKFPDYDTFWLDTINNLSRFAVGFFFIASGALLTAGLTKKKLIRIFAPYAAFCIVVGLFQNKPADLIVGSIFRGDLLPQLYFIPVLFQFYLLFPWLAKFRYKKYFLPVSIIVSYAAYVVPALAYIGGVYTFGPFLFLFAFGMAYAEKLKSKKTFDNIDVWLLIIPIYIGLQFMLPGRYFNSRFFYAPALFVVLHDTWHKFEAVQNAKILGSMGRLSLWIYLIHFSVESFFVNLLPYDFGYSVFLYILLITVLTAVGSWVISLLFSKYSKQ